MTIATLHLGPVCYSKNRWQLHSVSLCYVFIIISISFMKMLWKHLTLYFWKFKWNKKWDQVIMVIGSLKMKHLWSHLCTKRINKQPRHGQCMYTTRNVNKSSKSLWWFLNQGAYQWPRIEHYFNSLEFYLSFFV